MFLMMPSSSQNLYFQLGMNADDDGFCEHFTIMRMVEAKPDDLKILQAKGFVKVFDDKVLVITDWKENNYLRNDRYTPSKYLEVYKQEMAQLSHEKSGIPVVYHLDTQVRLGKVSKEETSKEVSYSEEIRTEKYDPDKDNEPAKPPAKKRDTAVIRLREEFYCILEKEHGTPPTRNHGDYIQLSKALKKLGGVHVRNMLEDAIATGKAQTVRGVFTDRAIDVYAQENL